MAKKQKDLSDGSVVNNRYRVERRLGASDLGQSYLCDDLVTGENQVVLRVMSHATPPAEQSNTFSRNFTLLRRLNHPALARVTDFGVLDSSSDLFVVRDWIQGKQVFDATEEMDGESILNVVMALSKALHYLHTRNIVHGHLSPYNAILASETDLGKLKLLDFGLNLGLDKGQTGRNVEMLAYAAPEVLSGGRISKTSDLYSLGILTYQLLARKLPFEDADPEFLIQKHLQSNVDLRPLERTRAGNRVSSLIRSLLRKDPDKRPSSAEEVIRLIIDALGHQWFNSDIKEMESHFCASQFVGRENEMSQLQESAKKVRDSGRGWTVFITGEAGSGKTRCMEELRSWALLSGWQVSEGTCGTREAGSYAPYRQILANSDPAEGEALFSFQDVPRSAPTNVFDAAPEYAAGQYRDLLTRELIRRMKARPTLLLLNDFHLADEATSTVLDYLSSDIQSLPVLMCVSLRSGDENRGNMGRVIDSVIRQERGAVLPLGPLEKKAVGKLIEGMTGDGRMKLTLGEWIYKSVGGNPFFLEEMLKHLVEQRLLCHELGRWRFLEEDLGKLEVPASVGAVLRCRFKQLSHSARELANWLALFQGNVPRSLLCTTIPSDASFVKEALQELNHRHMTRTEINKAEEAVGFVHSLIAEVIRGDLPKKLRRKMHQRIAEVIEQESGAEGHLQELALHYMEADAGEIAVRYAILAAHQARGEFAHEKALNCFEYVFKNRNGLTDAQLCNASIEASDTMFALGQPKRSIHLLRTEIANCRNVNGELKARMYMQLALSYQHLGDLHMQELCCKKGLSYLRNRPSGEINLTRAMLWAELAFAAILRSRSRRGLVYLDKARKSCPESSDALKGRIESLAASMHRIACNLRQARSASEKAAAILTRSGESYLACSAYSTLGIILEAFGRFPLSLENHDQAVSLSDKSRSVVLKSQALGNLAECLCRMGRTQEAVNTAERALRFVREANSPAIGYAFNAILAETRLAAGNYRGAHEVIQKLNMDARYNQARYVAGHVLYVSASLFLMLGKFDAAVGCIEKLRAMENRETPFYERELAEALYARILFERGNMSKAIAALNALERKVAQKHWPYQVCVIRLYLCEMFIKQGSMERAEQYAKKALRLAKPMQAVSLSAYAHFLLGLIYSPAERLRRRGDRCLTDTECVTAGSAAVNAIEELQEACRIAEPSCHAEVVWRAHAELSRILKLLRPSGDYMYHAKRAHELMCKAEDQVPSEMLPSYCSAFDRNRIKAELALLIESGRDRESSEGVTVTEISEDEKARILLRMSATVGSVPELGPLLEAILDQLVQAAKMERAIVFLKDELTGSLRLAKGRNDCQETITVEKDLDRRILMDVLKRQRPIVSANACRDPRFAGKDRPGSTKARRVLCAPLKLSDRILGVLYGDHSSPAGGLSESTVSLFSAFCSIAAMAIDNALAHQHLAREKNELQKYLHRTRDDYAEIAGRSACIELLRDRIGLAAESPVDILITGESGTGKELVARAIHRTGRRKNGKFIAVDCGALSDNLAEAELFGCRKGAFTGATEDRPGLLEAANGGILFLDELSNLPIHLQAKFLRVLQEREVRRLGETAPRKIDIQVIAATNKDLLEEIRNERFRGDLYYRLKIVEIRVPPLRERPEDIPLLIEWFLIQSAEPDKGQAKRFSPEALEMLKKYSYPGNVRELRNIVVGSYYSTVKTILGVDDLPPEVRGGNERLDASEMTAALRIYEEIRDGKGNFESTVLEPFLRRDFGASLVRTIIRKALEESGGVYRKAFGLLRIPEKRYSAIMQFLKRNNCYLDYRPFRNNSGNDGDNSE